MDRQKRHGLEGPDLEVRECGRCLFKASGLMAEALNVHQQVSQAAKKLEAESQGLGRLGAGNRTAHECAQYLQESCWGLARWKDLKTTKE